MSPPFSEGQRRKEKDGDLILQRPKKSSPTSGASWRQEFPSSGQPQRERPTRKSFLVPRDGAEWDLEARILRADRDRLGGLQKESRSQKRSSSLSGKTTVKPRGEVCGWKEGPRVGKKEGARRTKEKRISRNLQNGKGKKKGNVIRQIR